MTPAANLYILWRMKEKFTGVESTALPSNWNFPERSNIYRKVFNQIEPNHNFVSFTIDYLVDERPAYQTKDYFFDHEGNITDSRRHFSDRRATICLGLEIPTLYQVINNGNENSVGIYFDEPQKDSSSFSLPLLRIHYVNGRFDRVLITCFFMVLNGERVHSPSFPLGINIDPHRQFPSNAWKEINDNKYKSEKFSCTYLSRAKLAREIDVSDVQGNKVFQIVYGIKDIEVRPEGKMQKVFFSDQTHLETGIVKGVIAPLSIDIEKVNAAANVVPRYAQKRIAGLKILNVPWTNIGRVVGASISYSYPPPKQS